MFNCTDKTSRFYMGRLTTAIINKVFNIYEKAEDKENPNILELYTAATRVYT
jgi:hypothetical protein